MADSLASPKVEGEMLKAKETLESVKKKQTVFANTFASMQPRQRAEMVRSIMADQRLIGDFINAARKYDLRAPALKFGLENIKQKYQMVMNLWRKTEKLMDKGGTGGSGVPKIKTNEFYDSESPTLRAVSEYAQALQSMGHKPTDEMLGEFRDRLHSAYEKAKEKAGGRDLNVRVVQEEGKIKVKMEPK